MALEQDHRISEAVKREQSRLRNFIRRRMRQLRPELPPEKESADEQE